jgi:hypothetical protein
MKKILLFVLILWVSLISVKAQWTSNTMLNTTVRDSIGTDEATPLSVTRTDGSTYISFFEQYGSYYQLRMQLLDRFGNKLWVPEGLVVSSFPQSSALYRYDLKVDESGNAIVAFQDIRTAGVMNVVVYKIDASGNFLWGNSGIQIIDPVSAEGLAPNIGITGSNNVVIAWTADNGSAKWIAYQKITSAGSTAWSSVHRIIDSTFVKKYSRPTMVALDQDDFVMLYAEESGSGLGVSVMYAQHFGIGGTGIWTAPLQVSTKAIPFFFFPKAISDGSGGFYVAFDAGNAIYTTQSDVYVQHVSSTGVLWNATGNVACALPNSQHFTASSRYDHFNTSFWILIKVTDVNQSLSGVYVQSMGAAGKVQLGVNAVEVAPVVAAYNDPRDFSVTSDGVISIYSIGSSSLSQTLAAVKNTFTGTLAWGGNPVTICSNAMGKDDLSTGLFLFDQVVVVWDDNRNDFGVYAQNILNDGQIGVITSVTEINNENTFSVYPNPSDGIITLNINTALDIADLTNKVEILNSIGQVILTKEINEQSSVAIDLSEQAKGMYFVRLQSRSGVEVRKVILE